MKMLSKFGFVKRSFEIIFCNAMMPDKVKHFAVLALKSTFPFLIGSENVERKRKCHEQKSITGSRPTLQCTGLNSLCDQKGRRSIVNRSEWRPLPENKQTTTKLNPKGTFLTTGAPFLSANEKSTNSGQTKSFFSVFLKKPDSSDDWLNCVKPSNATCADCADLQDAQCTAVCSM